MIIIGLFLSAPGTNNNEYGYKLFISSNRDESWGKIANVYIFSFRRNV